MSQESRPADALVLSYLGLRTAVGIIGIALPFVLPLATCILALAQVVSGRPGLESSLSAYYYLPVAGSILVGSLCAIAMFLMSYRIDSANDRAGNIACLFALGVALFPTAPAEAATRWQEVFCWLHVACAAGFFLTLAVFCLKLFPRRDWGVTTQTREKKRRNFIYRLCGVGILLCLALIACVPLLPSDSPVMALKPVFWLEAMAVVSFGVAWLIKGRYVRRFIPMLNDSTS